ncbi:hypothetical protein CHISP_3472 [Chitinispirillum alkaliphilum]|nr:hypothetical protein CHISP_3472 [Chitinispirillum alkaliphilum]
MNVNLRFIVIFALLVLSAAAAQEERPALHPVQKLELLRLEKTWNILDQIATEVWPEWEGYADIPFLFDYENQTRMLVGHPNPPKEFELVDDVKVRNMKVYIDRTNEVSIELTWPTLGGGGPIPFGKEDDPHDWVQTVWITLQSCPQAQEGKRKYQSEVMILLYIHELFHCHQSQFYLPYVAGENFSMNANTNYAVYSDIEGQALLKAFKEEDIESAMGYLKDFVAARKLKYKDMSRQEQNGEKFIEFMEGTARYSEFMTLLKIRENYKPKLTSDKNPNFSAFEDINYHIEERLKYFKMVIGKTDDIYSKCYEYGCFQALMLDRIADNWQETIPSRNNYLFDLLVDKLNIRNRQLRGIKRGLGTRYNIDSLYTKYSQIIQARDDAFENFDAQKGQKFYVDFEPIGEIPHVNNTEKESYMKRLPIEKGGIRFVFPEGFGKYTMHEVSIICKELPLEHRDLFKIGFVDTKGTGYQVSSSGTSNNIHTDAVVETDGFTLKVPSMKIVEKDGNVIFSILSKVSTSEQD